MKKTSIQIKCGLLVLMFVTLFALRAEADQTFIELVRTGTPQQVENAIKKGADVNAKGNNGMTPLMYAARNNYNPVVVTVLIKAGADVNARQNNGATPLMYAAAFNPNPDLITALIKAGADVNAKSNDGLTPLISAAFVNPNPEVITTLLTFGADSKARDNEGRMAIDRARENQYLANTDALRILEEPSSLSQKESMVNRLADLAFFELCKTGTPQQVEAAIRNGTNVNNSDNVGRTPLMAALNNSNPEVITVLIKAGADINAKTNNGITTLMMAAISSNPEVIATLIKAGADVNARRNEETPLMMATMLNRYPEVITILLKAGADPRVMDRRGKMPIDYARENPHLANTEALRKLEEASH